MIKKWLYVDAGGCCGSIGLLVLRLTMGVAFILHGWPKIQSPMSWMGPDAPVPGIFQLAAAVSEFGGGIALIVGLLTPLFALGLAITMVVAAFVHISGGHPFVGKPGSASWEPAAVYLACSLAFLSLGPGRLSLDYLLFGRPGAVDVDPPTKA